MELRAEVASRSCSGGGEVVQPEGAGVRQVAAADVGVAGVSQGGFPIARGASSLQTGVQTHAPPRNGTGHHAHHCRALPPRFKTDAATSVRTGRDPDQEPAVDHDGRLPVKDHVEPCAADALPEDPFDPLRELFLVGVGHHLELWSLEAGEERDPREVLDDARGAWHRRQTS